MLTVNVNTDEHLVVGCGFCNYGVKNFATSRQTKKWAFLGLIVEVYRVLTRVLNVYNKRNRDGESRPDFFVAPRGIEPLSSV